MSGTPDEKWKPINKALLTPCRRPGLSRIVKTPLHIPENQELSVSNHKTPPAIKISLQQKTPVNSPPKCTKVVQLPSILKDRSLSNSIATDKTNGSNPEPKIPVVKISRIALPNKRTVKPKKVVHRLSIKRSTSPDELSDLDDFASTPENEPSPKEFAEQIAEIEKRIKSKETKLEDLKRAAAYAKINNVQELEELTRTWKDGCKKALDHLLGKLQEHCPMEMSSLLQKLNIPESVIETSDS
ncbi:hypothetical protein RI129_006833 [Pyrocoelia pectoralis]|uniref:Swi5-dependent recombination DNA repair protein 1 homolog n=1 Tax=Pyrocoelia pectoralis TaxID=417401 RepID=A0AAN7ZPB7_9COLE